VETIEGYFLIRVKQGKPIKMIAYKPGYINHEVILNYDKRVFFGNSQDVTLYLDSVALGGTISLNPIYFKKSTPAIVQESYSELDYLVEIMRQFTEITITVEGHTDSNGTPETLLKLSQDRAGEVRKYLIKNKIHPNRILTIGYGATKPLSKESDEDSRRLNRRVEFKITKIAY
jgi:OmpA-OmpF porin, OOP family